MDSNGPSRGAPSASREDRRTSRDVGFHLGWIKNLSTRWSQNQLAGFELNEIFHVAIVEAERILREKYDPDRATASTYLSRYLLGFVQYRLIKSTGKRKTPAGWVEPSPYDRPGPPPSSDPANQAELADLVGNMHPDLREAAIRLAAGDTLEAIAEDEVPRFQDSEQRREAVACRAAELRRMFHVELRDLLDD